MNNRTILITGATGRVGSALVHHFLSQGDFVVAHGRSHERLDQLSSSFPDYRDSLRVCCVDLMHAQSSKKIIMELEQRNISVTHLVNNARSLNFLEINDKGEVSRINFQNELTMDVIVPYELCIGFAESSFFDLRSVVNIGSQYGVVASNPRLYETPDCQSPIHYGVAKAALAHLTKELAVRYADKGVRFNCLAYGGIEGRVDEQFVERYSKMCPASRMLTIEEVAGPVDFLLSPASSSMTGHIMVADGGWSVW